MIYCVVPQELVDELYDKLVTYYGDNPDVTVIVVCRELQNSQKTSPPNKHA